MVMEGDLTRGGEHTIEYTDDVLEYCTPETYIILLTSVTAMHPMKKFKKGNIVKYTSHSLWEL